MLLEPGDRNQVRDYSCPTVIKLIFIFSRIVGALEILTVILMLALNVTDASVLGILQDIFAILLGLFLIAAAILKNIVMLKVKHLQLLRKQQMYKLPHSFKFY